ncbi:MAG TPA: hypothetical protein VMB84_05600 [Stellaceae bacterium]|nr:hypothetical protein [Stellaceae bacterium]
MATQTLLVGLLVLCGAASAASACQKTASPLLDDNFRNADPGWGQPDNVAAFTPQGLVLTPPVSGSAYRWNAGFTLAHNDWCVEVVNPARLPSPADEETVGSVGVLFWGQDLQNFYTATITLDGNAEIDRLNRGAWQVVVPPASASAIKIAPAAVNEIEVVTAGNRAAFYVNGALVTEISGRAPQNGGSPGIYGESGPNGTSWVFRRARLY